MKKSSIVHLVALLALLASSAELPGQEAGAAESQVTLSWEEFKRLLNLDENELVIPLDTFQKLLAQTGVKTAPVHSLEAGNVVLSRQEFQKLVEQMKPPEDPAAKPPFEYLVTRAVYQGKMGRENTAFSGTFAIHVLKKEGYLEIPLLPQSIALEDMKVDGRPALVVSDGGYHKVVLSGAGEYAVTASFSMKSSLEKGPYRVDLDIQQTPITLLELELPLEEIDVEVPQAQQLLTRVRDGTTLVSAILSPGRSVSVRWRKKVPVAEKVPPKLYAEVYHLVSIEDDALKIDSDIAYNILHSEVDGVRLVVPDDTNVLSVSGEGVGEWKEEERDGRRLLQVPFTYGKKGAVALNVIAEKPLSEGGLTNAFSGLQVLDCVRETGSIGVELNTSAEVVLAQSEGLEAIAVQKLPRRLFGKSVKPLLLGFKYLRHPYSMVLEVKKHEKIAVPVATIHSANAVTLFTEDGKVVHRIVYQVRNSAKQFLEIQLPEAADVWSVSVGAQPVESSLNGQGKLLVPLIRSRSVDDRLDTFPVEIIFAVVEERFSWAGSRGSVLPEADLMISQLMWSVYLPNDYAYNYFSSTLEKEEIIRGLNLFATVGRRYNEEAMRELYQSGDLSSDERRRDRMEMAYEGKESRSQFRNIPVQEEQITSQMEAEMEFGGRLDGLKQKAAPSIPSGAGGATGVLPIQIQIPTGGQLYRFARTIVKSDDLLTFGVIYTRSWVNSLAKWVASLVVILAVLLNRKRLSGFWTRLKGGWDAAVSFCRSRETALRGTMRARMTPFVLFGLLALAWPFSRSLTLLLLFLLWVNVVYQVLNWRRKKAEADPGNRADDAAGESTGE